MSEHDDLRQLAAVRLLCADGQSWGHKMFERNRAIALQVADIALEPALTRIRYADETAERWRKLWEMVDRERSEAVLRAERVDERHQPVQKGQWVSCSLHSTWSPDPGCEKCAKSPIWKSTNTACGSWPCEDHLTLHDETEETCAHHASRTDTP